MPYFALDPTCFDCDGTLTINSVSMFTPAWCVLSLAELLEPLGAIRGDDVIIPRIDGRRAYRRRRDEKSFDLPMMITGWVDLSGNPQADPLVGLRTNLDYLRANVIDPSLLAPVSSVFTLTGGGTRSADVIVGGWRLGQRSEAVTFALMTIVVPAGEFV